MKSKYSSSFRSKFFKLDFIHVKKLISFFSETKLCVTETDVFKFKTACCQPHGTKTVSPSFCINENILFFFNFKLLFFFTISGNVLKNQKGMFGVLDSFSLS